MSSLQNEADGGSAGGGSNVERRAWECLWVQNAKQSLETRTGQRAMTCAPAIGTQRARPLLQVRAAQRAPQGWLRHGRVTGLGMQGMLLSAML